MSAMSPMGGPRTTFGRGRRLTIFVNVVVMVVLAMTVAGIGIYLTGFTEIRRRFDLTSEHTYTLDIRTKRILGDLEKDVEIITAFDHVPWPYLRVSARSRRT
jgi:hypothetical protein